MAIFIYPAQQINASNPSIGVNGSTAPLSSTQIAGTDGTDLIPILVDNTGALALPAGAATETTLASVKVDTNAIAIDTNNTAYNTANISTKTDNINLNVQTLVTGQAALATGVKQDTGNASLASIDSKVATATKQDTGNASLSSIDSKVIASVVDANNSSTTSLAGLAAFTGIATEIKNYGSVSVLVASDVAAAVGGLSLQFSNDGTNWDHSHNFDFAGGNLSYNISAEARYFRIVYTNGASPQTYFRLQTILKPVAVPPSQYTVAQPLTDYALSTVTKGVIYGKTTGGGGGYVAVKVSPSGALTVDSTITSSVLPTGAATEATLQSIDTDTTALASTVSAGKILVDGSSVTQPVSAASLPLPTGAATESTLQSIEADTTTLAGTVSAGKVLVDGSGVTQPISASSLPLPTGAATETTLLAVKTAVENLDNAISGNELQVDVVTSALPTGAATESTLQSIEADTTILSGTVSAGKVLVDGSGVTQPISAASLPLPTGAATESTLSALNTKVVTTANGIKVDGSAVTQPVSGTVSVSNFPATQPVSGTVTANAGTGTFAVSAASLPLPTGAATETTLQAIEADTTVLAGTVSAGKVLVDGSSVTQPISAASLPLPAGAATETTLSTRASESTLSTLNGKIPSNLTVTSTRLLVDNSGVTQPISAASLPLPSGAATESTLSALNLRLAGSLTPVRFDEIALTYLTTGNGTGEIGTAVFKLATVTVKTLTLSYDSNNRLTGVVAT